jgi:hypothetical protein
VSRFNPSIRSLGANCNSRYAAVLVVFLSSDLAGPQQVVVVDFAGGGSLVLATSTATPIQVTSISSPSEQLTSTNYLANPTTTPGVGSTLTTVVMPTIQLPATQPSTLSATPTSTVATLESPTIGFSQGSDTPTSTPEFWTSARIAGVVIGVLIGVVLIVCGSVYIDTRYYRQDYASQEPSSGRSRGTVTGSRPWPSRRTDQ